MIKTTIIKLEIILNVKAGKLLREPTGNNRIAE